MKSKLWKKGDILKVASDYRITDLADTFVEFRHLGLATFDMVIRKRTAALANVVQNEVEHLIPIARLTLVSRPGFPFKIGQKVQLKKEPEKQATVIGFEKYGKYFCCILDRKLNSSSLYDGPTGKDFPENASLWSCDYLSPVIDKENFMKSKSWLKWDILKVVRPNFGDLPILPSDTLVKFIDLSIITNKTQAIVTQIDRYDPIQICLTDLKFVSRPSIPFKIDQQVQLTREPEKQATIIGFHGKNHCVLNQKLNPEKIELVDISIKQMKGVEASIINVNPKVCNFPENASLWHKNHLSPVELTTRKSSMSDTPFETLDASLYNQIPKAQGKQKTNPFAKFNPLRLIRKVS